MTYPILSRDHVRAFVTEVLIREDLCQELVDEFLDQHALRISTLSTSTAATVGKELHDAAIESGHTDKALEPIESQFSGPVFDAMTSFPLEALGSIDFWTYVSAKHFWGFVVLRQRDALIKVRRAILGHLLATPDPESEEHAEDPEGAENESRFPLERYVIGRDHYQIPLRLFLRAQAVGGEQTFLDDHFVAKGTDFWRSHVLGVRTGAYPNWSRPLVEAQAKQGFTIKAQREPAKAINRIRANVSPILHTEEEAAAIVTPLWRSS